MKEGKEFRAEKPASVWNKPLKLNFKDFFKGLTGSVADVALGKIDSLPKDIEEIVSSIGLKTTPEERAWLLTYRSITAAIQELVNESINMFESVPEDLSTFCEQLNFSFEDQPVVIDENLFLHPSDLPLLHNIRLVLQEWLIGYGFDDAQAAGVGARLRSYFVYALNAEWRRRPLDYAPISEMVNTPFTKAEERERNWNQYNSWLQRQIDASMFDEAFSLSQVYVPLRAYYEEKEKGTKGGKGKAEVRLDSEHEPVCHVVDLQTSLDKWLKRRDKEDAIRVISGGPGCGKSSFAKVYAAHIAQTGETRVLFIPLHQFKPKDDLIEAVGDFATTAGHFSHNPLNPTDGEKQLLIIFDGLDELSKQGRVGAEIAQQFVREVERIVGLRNNNKLRIQVLLSGRALFVQANASEFRKHEEVLHILPYYESERFAPRINDPDGLLKSDQRDLWWHKYGKVSGKNYSAMPEEFKSKDLQDITAEPLLNYLFAISYTQGDLMFTGDVNLNEIYEALLERVYHRGYGESRLRQSIPEMSEKEFFYVLEEIGLAAWHGGGRTTTIKEIMSCCKSSGVSDLLDKFQEGAEKGVTRLLSAFYFREADEYKGSDRTFEFTHKSFGEYLTVRRMMRLLKLTHNELDRHAEVRGAGWDYDHALEEWAWLFGPAPMDNYLFDFLCREIQRCETSVVESWQQTLVGMINYMLRNGMPMEKLRGGLAYAEQRRQARNAEEALLAVLNSFARCTRKISHIEWPDRTCAGEWIKFLQQQRTVPDNHLALQCLSFIDMTRCILHMADLYHADLSNSNLSQFSAFYACMTNANLDGANLGSANLWRADLDGANLWRANLEGANLDGANLRRANLDGANLEGADLERANLDGAYLDGANLERANLDGANLDGAKVSKQQLTHTRGVAAILPEGITRDDIQAARRKSAKAKKADK